jgi:carbonic anhydrase/acetyltransferase-like protein (isoleucine patch superfamily)
MVPPVLITMPTGVAVGTAIGVATGARVGAGAVVGAGAAVGAGARVGGAAVGAGAAVAGGTCVGSASSSPPQATMVIISKAKIPKMNNDNLKRIEFSQLLYRRLTNTAYDCRQ